MDWKAMPLWGKALLVLGICAGIILVAFNWLPPNGSIKTLRAEIVEKKGKLAQLNAQITELRILEGRMAALIEKVKKLEEDLNKLKKIMPPTPEPSELIRRLEGIAKRSRIEVHSTKFSRLREREFYREYPIALSISANYHDLILFLDRLSKEKRIFNISNLKLSGSRKGSYTLKATFTATTYVYKEPKREKPDGGPGAKNKNKNKKNK